MTVRVLTTCHTQYTWDSSICIFLFNRTTLQVFVTYLTGALDLQPLRFYKHQHENRVCSKLFVACQHVAFSLPFTAILVNCAPSGEMHNYCTPHIIKENFENSLIHRCNYILLSQVYCVWQVVKTLTVIFNNPVFLVKRNSPVYSITPSRSVNVTELVVVNSGTGSTRNSIIKQFTNQHIFGNMLTQKNTHKVIKIIFKLTNFPTAEPG
jgi:hypothetical protein